MVVGFWRVLFGLCEAHFPRLPVLGMVLPALSRTPLCTPTWQHLLSGTPMLLLPLLHPMSHYRCIALTLVSKSTSTTCLTRVALYGSHFNPCLLLYDKRYCGVWTKNQFSDLAQGPANERTRSFPR